MKKLLVVLTLFIVTAQAQAQELKQIPQISISGEGKILVSPDIAIIQLGVQNKGKDQKNSARIGSESIKSHSQCRLVHNPFKMDVGTRKRKYLECGPYQTKDFRVFHYSQLESKPIGNDALCTRN